MMKNSSICKHCCKPYGEHMASGTQLQGVLSCTDEKNAYRAFEEEEEPDNDLMCIHCNQRYGKHLGNLCVESYFSPKNDNKELQLKCDELTDKLYGAAGTLDRTYSVALEELTHYLEKGGDKNDRTSASLNRVLRTLVKEWEKLKPYLPLVRKIKNHEKAKKLFEEQSKDMQEALKRLIEGMED